MAELTIGDSIGFTHGRALAAACGRLTAFRWVLGLSLALAVQGALAQAMYRIKPLGTLGGCTTSTPVAAGFNNAGRVAGTACNSRGERHGFVWKNDGGPMVDLGPSTTGSTSEATGINASGVVAGNAQDGTGEFAFVSSGDGRPMRRLYNPWGRTRIRVLDINDRGQLTGYANRDDFYDDMPHAFVWRNDGSALVDLGVCCGYDLSYGSSINASGQIAGETRVGDSYSGEATVWRSNGTVIPLGTLSSGRAAVANFINASGQVAGNSATSGYSFNHAYFWENDGRPMQDLGTLGGAESIARALNDSGQVAGWSNTGRPDSFRIRRAFVWLNDGMPMRNLGTFGGTGSEASDINASGQVTGWAHLAGDAVRHAFLWRNDGSRIQDLNNLIDPVDPLKAHVTLDRGLNSGNQPINTTSAPKSVTSPTPARKPGP
jgi:probable HAF family extracellular repeat protein